MATIWWDCFISEGQEKGDKLNDLVIDFAQQLLKSQSWPMWNTMHSITIKKAGTS